MRFVRSDPFEGLLDRLEIALDEHTRRPVLLRLVYRRIQSFGGLTHFTLTRRYFFKLMRHKTLVIQAANAAV